MDGETPFDPALLATWVLGVPPSPVERTPYRDIAVERVTTPSREMRGASPSESEAPEFVRRALVDAIDVALAGVQRVAVMTGGGVDSSVLLGLATQWAKRTGGSAFAVSLDFEGPDSDRPYLRDLERHLQCEVIRVSPEEAAPRMSLLSSGADAAPVWHPMMPMEVEMLSRARAHGAERVLCGAGGDQLFGGSPQSLADMAWRGHPVRAVRAARRLTGFGRPRRRTWSWVLRPLLGRALPRRLRGWRDRRSFPLTTPDWAGPVVRSFIEEQRRLASVAVCTPPRTPAQRFEAMRDHPDRWGLEWVRHQEAQAAGVDVWWPYLDFELAVAVASLHPDYLLFGDRWRGLLRASIRGLVPESIRERADKAFFEPAMHRFVEAAGGLESLRPLASGRALASLGLVEPAPFSAAFDRFVASDDDGEAWMSFWPALAVEAFLRGRAS